jgi:hypothetical protein
MKAMKKGSVLILMVSCLTLCLGTHSAFSESSNYELERRIKQLEERVGVAEEGEEAGIGRLTDKISLSGTIELDYSHADDRDISDNTINDSTSDLDIGTVELGLAVGFHEYVRGSFILKGESLDSDSTIFWDEAAITIQKQCFPLYFVGGKRTQPFGLFETHLISDPITQDCYEIAKTGATVGYTADIVGLDISATIYKGEELMTHLVGAEYGFERDASPAYESTDDVCSYIGNISLLPMEGLILSVYYDSEPGDGNRNQTAGATIHYQMGKFTLDAEYIAALSREKHFTDNKEYKESAWFVGAAFQASDPLEIAGRYESFDDDIPGDQDGHLQDRYNIGFTYRLFEKDSFVCNLMGEYRRSNFEVEPENPNGVDDGINEFFARLAVEF